jgi:hypothetical protein
VDLEVLSGDEEGKLEGYVLEVTLESAEERMKSLAETFVSGRDAFFVWVAMEVLVAAVAVITAGMSPLC